MYGFKDELLARILSAEELAGLETLVLYHDRNGRMPEDEVLVEAMSSPFRSRTVHLAVGVDDTWRGPSEAVVQAMARNPHLQRVRRLNLSRCQLTTETVTMLADAVFFPQLVELDLSGCQLTLVTWARLLELLRTRIPAGQLKWLRLSDAIADEHFGTPLVFLTSHTISDEFDRTFGAAVVDRQSVFVDPYNWELNEHPSAKLWNGIRFK